MSNPLLCAVTGISHPHTSQGTHTGQLFWANAPSSFLQYFYLPFKTRQASGFINAAISMLIMPSMLKSLLAARSGESFGFIKAQPPPCCCSVCVTKLRSAPECNVTHMLGCLLQWLTEIFQVASIFLVLCYKKKKKKCRAHNVCIMCRFSGAEILPPSTHCGPSWAVRKHQMMPQTAGNARVPVGLWWERQRVKLTSIAFNINK